MGVVYYANYFVWFEVGRCDLLRTLGWSYRAMEEDGIYLPVIDATCEYKQPARYDDDIEIMTSGALVSPVRMEFFYEVGRVGEDIVLAHGRTAHASLDASGKPCRLPDRIRSAFA